MLHRAGYRIGQAINGTFGHLDGDEVAAAVAELPDNLKPLFLAMRRRDQRHAVGVLRRLGPAPDVLRQAALLHDVGKVRVYAGTPGRTLVVLARATGTLALLFRVPLLGPRLRAYTRHPELGAEMLSRAGAARQLVDIVAEHQDDEPRLQLTRQLQRADGRE